MEIKQLSFAADNPPLSVLSAAKVAAVVLPAPTTVTDSSSPPTVIFSDGYLLSLIFLPFLIPSDFACFQTDPVFCMIG